MKREEIEALEAMEAGKELDRLAIVHVLDWRAFDSWEEYADADTDGTLYPVAFWNTQYGQARWSVFHNGETGAVPFAPSSNFGDIGYIMDALAQKHIALCIGDYCLPAAHTIKGGKKSSLVFVESKYHVDSRPWSDRCALAATKAALLAILDPARHVWHIEKVVRGEIVADYVFDHYINAPYGLCTLCANTGIIDTRGRKSPAGVEVGCLNYCLCPNGQAMREREQPLAL